MVAIYFLNGMILQVGSKAILSAQIDAGGHYFAIHLAIGRLLGRGCFGGWPWLIADAWMSQEVSKWLGSVGYNPNIPHL